MDNGGYKIILDLPPYEIDDCGSYFVIYKNSKYVGEFKNRDSAFKYCFLEYFDEAGDYIKFLSDIFGMHFMRA